MLSIFLFAKRLAKRSASLALFPALVVCSGDTSTGTIKTPAPAAVSDLIVSAVAVTSATLTFTQVEDGAGHAASYDVRYAVAPISWGVATSTASGTCSTPASGTSVGSSLTCSVLGLSAATSYDFQVRAFRGSLNSGAVFGSTSNVASAATLTPPPPASTVTTVTVAPASPSISIGAMVTLQATVADAQGNVMTGQTVTWSTDNAAAATVNASGVVTGVAAGAATITATCAGKSGTASVTVTSTPPPVPVVTTVTVAPLTASIVAGATVTLSATVKDALGNLMMGQTIVWSTNNPGAGTVSSNGVVTGVGAGVATITATCSGKTGSSAVTVTVPPPAPPPPPGGTLLFQENFEDASLASRGWYDNTGVVLSTTEHIAGSTSSAQYRFLAGATSPTSGGSQRHKFSPTNSFYLSYNVKYSANWVGSNLPYHPHEFNVMSTLDGDYDGPSNGYMVLYVEQSYQNGGKPRLGVQDNKSVNSSYGPLPYNLVGTTENRSTGGCNGMSEVNMAWECYDAGGYWYNLKQFLGPVVFQPSAGPGYKNSWNFVEAYFQLNTVVNGIGQADGVMQYWFNGALIIDRHDIVFRTGAHSTIQFNQFLIAPYIGAGSPVDQSMFIDNLRVATSRIP
jgi:uncharacterized protein YjdB